MPLQLYQINLFPIHSVLLPNNKIFLPNSQVRSLSFSGLLSRITRSQRSKLRLRLKTGIPLFTKTFLKQRGKRYSLLKMMQSRQNPVDPFADDGGDSDGNGTSLSSSSRTNTDTTSVSITATTRKQRFLNLMKTTKDVYIPQLRSTISQKASSRFKAAMEEPYLTSAASWIRQERSQPQQQQQQRQRVLPQDMHIVFYPTYSCRVTQVENGTTSYETVVRLTVNVPANLTSRKNKLILSVCKQALLTQPIPPQPTTTTITETDSVNDNSNSFSNSENNNSENNKYLYHSKTDTNLLHTGTSSRGTRLVNSQSETNSLSSTEMAISEDTPSDNLRYQLELDTLRERLSGFLAGAVGDMPVTIELFDTAGNYHTLKLRTDIQGNITTRITTQFVPERIKISIDTPEDYPKTVSAEFSCTYLKPTGIGLISDIDDTVKHTGVTGDKRSLARNVFIQDAKDWVVEGMPRWYNTLHDVFSTDLFYVSNSPIQLYGTLQSYISDNFPMGPIFLKQYVGNILSSVMASSAARKLKSIEDIIRDFPQKKFILVGDTGERDFEAYVSIATQFPDQILGIYIRRCQNSITEFEGKEDAVMADLNRLIKREMRRCKESSSSSAPPAPPVVPPKRVQLTATQLNSIIDSRQTKLHEADTRSRAVPPTLPPRSRSTLPPSSSASSLSSNGSFTPTQMNTTKPSTVPPPISASTPDLSTSYSSEYFDRLSDSWRTRLIEGIERLNNARVHDIGLMIFSEPEVALEDTVMRIRKLGEA